MKFFKKFRITKAQVNIMSAILITAILLAAVAGTYIWAQPIMVKASDKKRIDYARDMLDRVRKAIEDAAFQQQQRVISVDYDKGTLKISKDIDTDEYVLDYLIETNIPMLASTKWVPLTGSELPIQEDARYIRSWCAIKEVGNSAGWPADSKIPFGGSYPDCEYDKYNNNNQLNLKKAYQSCMAKLSEADGYDGFGYSRENIKIGEDEYKALICSASSKLNYVCLMKIKKISAESSDTEDYLEGECKWKSVGGKFTDLGDGKTWKVSEIHPEKEAIVGLMLSSGYVDKLGEKDTNPPCIIIAKSRSRAEMRTAQLRIKCRPVINSQENIAYDIIIKPGNTLVAPPGKHKISVSYQYDKTLPPQPNQHWTTKQIFVELSIT